MSQTGQWVIKLGGSFAQSPHLPRWLEALSNTNAIIVPGGGPFADAVRLAQTHWQFDDPTAHHMAILGMRQYGRMLAGLCPKLRMATTLEELQASPDHAKVWLPMPEMLDEADISASWDITSDSLAAWLAGQIKAQHLLLVKSIEEITAGIPSLNSTQLVNQGWVDRVFPEYAAKSSFQSWLCGPSDYTDLMQSLTNPEHHFIRISHQPSHLYRHDESLARIP